MSAPTRTPSGSAVGGHDAAPGWEGGSHVFLRPIAMPLPMGFLGLMTATSTLAALQLGWIPTSQGHVAGLVALAFAAPLQLVACIWGFLARDPVAGTGMGVLGVTWAVTGLVVLTSPAGSTSAALGVMLCGAAVALLVPAVSGTRKYVANAVLVVAAARFAVTGVYEVTAAPDWKTVAGIVGLVLAAVALYAALAFELEGARGRTILPTGRPEPVQDLPEPGIRSWL